MAAGSYYNATLGQNNTLGGDVIITNNLFLTGISNTGVGTLIIDCFASVEGAGANSYMMGSVTKNFCGNTPFTFPVGTPPNGAARNEIPEGFSSEYTPVDIAVNSGTYPASLNVDVVDTYLPGLGTTSSTSRYWNVTKPTGTLNVDMTFHYLDEDVHGNEAAYVPFKYNGTSTFSVAGSVNAAANTITATGVVTFSGWAAGVLAPTAASVDVSGTVRTADGRPIKNVSVTLTGGPLTEPRYAQTGNMGIYQFEGLPVGTYVVSVASKRFSFNVPSHLVNLNDNVTAIDFFADPQE
jgi:hypothetical protein